MTASVSGGNGTIAPPSQIGLNSGSPATLTVVPALGYQVQSVVGDTCSVSQTLGATWTTGAITSNCTITATFIATFTVNASVVGGNGTITPPPQSVNLGAAAAFTVTPSAGFLVQSVVGDTCTVTQTSGTTWTSSAIGADCNVVAIFAADALVFTTQPADILRGTTLGTVVVTEEDSTGSTIDDNATVDFTIAACGASVDLGSVPMVHGVATLNSGQRFYTVHSGLQIVASAGSLGGLSGTFNVAANSDILSADGFDGCRL